MITRNETDILMNDTDTGFVAPVEIQRTGNPDNASVLTPEIVDEGTAH